jgi:hypothetical protein
MLSLVSILKVERRNCRSHIVAIRRAHIHSNGRARIGHGAICLIYSGLPPIAYRAVEPRWSYGSIRWSHGSIARAAD